MKNLKIKLTISCLVFFLSILNAQVSIIPRPMSVVCGDGCFKLDIQTNIVSQKETINEANYLASILERCFGQRATLKSKGNGIILKITPSLEEKLGVEGYLLKSEPERILIEGATSTGVFYGIQTLRQLLPANFEFNNQEKTISVPVVKVTDKPNFPWRAFMLDESRHFKGVDVVKNLLDQMALLKMNTFHWHLTDDQGWRIEIKKYPNLTKMGSYREDSQVSRRSPERFGVSHEGFYTQEQIKEIIQYATELHIQIIPEIEMPGHAMAAIASYPWLGVLGTTTKVPEEFGKQDDSFNIANPKVYQFLTDVLMEVFDLFPSHIVHIGGDEVTFQTWQNSQVIQDKMKKENLASPADLQVFFTNQISNFIESNEHRMMGWNEILGVNVHEWNNDEELEVKQKLAKSAIVHFWKGNLELINEAVSNGYDIVNSYHRFTYLDYNYKTIPLSKAYSFNPIPEGLNEKYNDKILGLGCQMWSEWIPTVGKMNMQIFPRLAAYAEVGWTLKSNKDFDSFVKSLNKFKERWKLSGINYHQPFD